jgi:hypothetical protein
MGTSKQIQEEGTVPWTIRHRAAAWSVLTGRIKGLDIVVGMSPPSNKCYKKDKTGSEELCCAVRLFRTVSQPEGLTSAWVTL